MTIKFYFFLKLYSGTSRYKTTLTYTAILRYLLIENETHEKNHISNECTGSEFRFGVVPPVCNGG
ncbi:hypothetical protein DJ535_06005 [Citrobacter murliniae]|uniref:Uncharacterized protein n=1 Tax=Citrobacter murliniae TaxID=67829 RepID=A0ABY2PXF7_9ENTR|nr:hypothetical protein DJ535_06005 [Citrobacter murliniae]